VRAKTPPGTKADEIAAAYNGKIAEATKAIDALTEEVAGLENQIATLKADAKKAHTAMAEAEKQPGFDAAKASRYKNQLARIDKSIHVCQQTIASRKNEIDDLEKQIKSLQKSKAEALKKAGAK
jgi:uncharacterized coiled-coil DUF342 family protein